MNDCRSTVRWFLMAVLFVGFGAFSGELLGGNSLSSQSTEGKTGGSQAGDGNRVDGGAAQERFDEATARLREAVKGVTTNSGKFFHSPLAESEDWREQWKASAKQGEQASSDLAKAAEEILLNTEKPSEEVLKIARLLQHQAFENYEYERTYLIARRLFELKPEYTDAENLMGRTALLTNRYDEVREFMGKNGPKISSFPESEVALFQKFKHLDQIFQKELTLRYEERLADDLPRVELETSQGKIVVELYEDQAPETVASFIYLVENKYYDEMLFHRVIKNQLPLSVAQSGYFSRAGPQTPGYEIYDEHEAENARGHFRGVLGMAKTLGVPNSAQSQFYITTVPIPFLNGQHTAFGRVISDMQVVDRLRATYTMDDEGKETAIEGVVPDRILSAKVLRKRDHEYKPHRVEK